MARYYPPNLCFLLLMFCIISSLVFNFCNILLCFFFIFFVSDAHILVASSLSFHNFSLTVILLFRLLFLCVIYIYYLYSTCFLLLLFIFEFSLYYCAVSVVGLVAVLPARK